MSGSVYDSITHAPLEKAVIQLVSVDATDPKALLGQVRTATSDSRGAFSIENVQAGRYALGFQHPDLEVLGMETRIIRVEVLHTPVVVDLAIPASPELRATLCPVSTEDDHHGVVFGVVLLSATEGPAAGAEIVAEWRELAFARRSLTTAARSVSATVAIDGTYRLCGVPSEGIIAWSVRSKGMHEIRGELVIPESGIARHDARLVQVTELRGHATIALRVVDSASSIAVAGDVALPTIGRSAKLSEGVTVLSDLPAGSWLVRVRALGYEPKSQLVDATEGESGSGPIRIALQRQVPSLDTVNVIAKRLGRDQKTLAAVQERMRLGFGSAVTADKLETAIDASDAVRQAKGFIVRGPTSVEGRPYPKGFGAVACRSASTSTSLAAWGTKEVAVYLDGSRMPGGLETINNMLRPSDILVVEAYSDVSTAPVYWRTNDACAVVAFWTKH